MYIVETSKGIAYENYISSKGSIRLRSFSIYLDDKGAYIRTMNGKVYLTEKNSKFI
jgi:hypothetical protein